METGVVCNAGMYTLMFWYTYLKHFTSNTLPPQHLVTIRSVREALQRMFSGTFALFYLYSYLIDLLGTEEKSLHKYNYITR